MKLVLKLGLLASHSKKSLLVAYRNKATDGDHIAIQSLELQPPGRFRLSKEGDEFVIRIQMQDGEFLALDQEPGIAEKSIVK